MRFVFQNKRKLRSITVAWQLMPFFIADNRALILSLTEKLHKEFLNREITDEVLDAIHNFIIDKICEEYKFSGLKKYLSSVENLDISGETITYNDAKIHDEVTNDIGVLLDA